jgi:hypothetical protein
MVETKLTVLHRKTSNQSLLRRLVRLLSSVSLSDTFIYPKQREKEKKREEDGIILFFLFSALFFFRTLGIY